MGIQYDDLSKFYDQMKLLEKDVNDICEACAKEIAARLLAKVIKRTPVQTGTLRRGWSGNVQNMKVKKTGDLYTIEVINPVEYAEYVEYGHRTKDHKGWVPGKFFLTISEEEIRQSADGILEKKIANMLKEKGYV